MRTRIRCPWHHEATPSLVRQKTQWWCYGACNKGYTQAEVEAKVGEAVPYEEAYDDKEDLAETFKYINSLPRREYRGFQLPYNERGVYLCWPDSSYYKFRVFNPRAGGKYLSPKGHRPTLFWVRKRT